MALDFPANPTNGQAYQGFIWSAANSSWDSAYAPRAATIPISSPNYIINGAFDIWQRGTSATMNAFNTYKAADRWTGYKNGTTGTESRQGTGLSNIQYCGRYQRSSGTTDVEKVWVVQSIETANSIPLVGKTATLSFYARAGANFSAASNYLKAQIVSGTGTDQNVLAGFTGEAFPVDQNVTLTTSWQRFTLTGAIGAAVTQLGIRFNYTPTGTAGANDYFEITGVQLEDGAAATDFRRNQPNIQAELAACQRYYYRRYAETVYAPFGSALGDSTTAAFAYIQHPVKMRTTPTSTLDWSGNLNDYMLYGTSSITALTGLSIVADQNSSTGTHLYVTGPSVVGGRAYAFMSKNTTAAYIGFSAEL